MEKNPILKNHEFGVERAVLGAVLLSVLIYWVIDFGLDIPLTSQFIGLFAMGTLGAHISYGTNEKLARLKKWPWTWLTFLAGILALISGAIHFGPHGELAAMKEYLFGLFAMPLMVAASFPTSLAHRLLSLGPLVLTGSFAYSIYLIHAPILAFLFEYLLVPLKMSNLQAFVYLTLMGFPAVILTSYVLFKFFEYPFLSKKIKVPSILSKEVSPAILS